MNIDMPRPAVDASDASLALWMLELMRDSAGFLDVIRSSRKARRRDVLDTPDYVERHQSRLRKLYQSDAEDDAPMTSATSAKIAAVIVRDMLSSREELIEKALSAYLEKHPGSLDTEWQTTFEAARAEIEGRTKGAFEPGFVGGLAAAAREELQRETRTRTRGHERGD